jgi:DNA-directed RNA polymerase subunit RPC12/RpoP
VPDEESPKSVRCPECSSFDVRRSYPTGLLDAILNRRGLNPLRCRRCSHRFYRKLQPDEVLGLPERAYQYPPQP